MRKILITMMLVLSLAVTGCTNNANIATTETAPVTTVTTEEITMVEEPVATTETTVADDVVIPTVEPTTEAEPTVNGNDNTLSQNDHRDFDAEYGLFVTYDAGYTKYALYGFDKNVTRGSVATNNLRWDSVTSVNYEAYYGTTAYVDGTTVYIKAYNHSKEHPIVGSIIKSDNSSRAISISYDEYTAIDCADFADGLYIVSTAFDTADNTIDAYIYVANNGVWLARVFHDVRSFPAFVDDYHEAMQAIEDANIQPEDCLYLGDIVYPCPTSAGHRCDTDAYIELSHEILDSHPDWSDECKIFALTNWFLQNIAYDDWRVANGRSRAMEYGVWDGTYSMLDMHVGVCCDFSNAMVIMLREQGIPVTSFESNRHMWNVVYLNGHWVPLDITPMLSMRTNAEDGHVTSNCRYSYNSYLTYNKSDTIVSVGADIWTLDRHRQH